MQNTATIAIQDTKYHIYSVDWPDQFRLSSKIVYLGTIALAAINDNKLANIDENPMTQLNTAIPTSHFFRLPAELRNAIYELVVAEDTPIREEQYVEQGIFQTCHQIREESSKIFYRLNTFRFNCHVVRPVLLEMTRECIGEIPTIHIHTGRVATSWREDDVRNLPLVLCLDISNGLREIKHELRRDDNYGTGPFELLETCCQPTRGHRGVFERLRVVQYYLDYCSKKARPGTPMTIQIFDKITKILVGEG